MDFFFAGFQLLFYFVFLIIIIVFVVMFARGLRRWGQNNRSPRLTVDATVVAKRMSVSHHHHAGDTVHHHHSSTTYYVTFQVESGDRMELHVPADAYGLMVEGDRGKLTFQGTRFLDFLREF